MQKVYVLFEENLDSLGSDDMIAIVKDKATAKQFIKDYQKDPDNQNGMLDVYYETWDLTNHYDEVKGMF